MERLFVDGSFFFSSPPLSPLSLLFFIIIITTFPVILLLYTTETIREIRIKEIESSVTNSRVRDLTPTNVKLGPECE